MLIYSFIYLLVPYVVGWEDNHGKQMHKNFKDSQNTVFTHMMIFLCYYIKYIYVLNMYVYVYNS